jgi:hypothetical protein
VTHLLTRILTKVSIKREKLRDLVHIHGQMEVSMKACS